MPSTAFLFPGQGAFLGGAVAEAGIIYPGVRRTLGVVEEVAKRRFGRSLLALLNDASVTAEKLLGSDPAMLQLGVFTLSLVAFEMLQSEGVRPDVVIGHSLGEIAALTCAQIYTVRQGADIVCDRIEALQAAPQGGMAALSAGPERVRQLLAELPAQLRQSSGAPTIAVENHDSQTVVSGGAEAMSLVLEACGKAGIGAQRLMAPHAFHHFSLSAAAAQFKERLRAYSTGHAIYPVYSPILGRFYTDDDSFEHLLSQHLMLPVAFSSALRVLHDTGLQRIIECGALNSLSKIAVRVLGPGTVKTFPIFISNIPALHNLRKITQLNLEESNMTASLPPSAVFANFESFWNERSPVLMAQIKAEFMRFVEAEHARLANQPQAVTESTKDAAPAAARRSREQLFTELVAVYAEAMEYPTEVFTESIELEAELGIDSVKQTEIIGRISAAYGLPPLPPTFRSGDIKTMGQIVDFVYAQQDAATAAV